MNHFVKKYFNKIVGAGGKPPLPDQPPPPSLKPPILGDLAAISSFEYLESLDLISDGPIDGFVNPDGRYVEDIGLFESIYLNDTQIKQSSSTDANQNVFDIFSLSTLTNQISGHFYQNGVFQEKRASDVGTPGNSNFISGEFEVYSTNNPNIVDGVVQSNGTLNYRFIDGKNNIATDILATIQQIPDNTSDVNKGADESLIQADVGQQKVVNNALTSVRKGKFNYASASEVSAFLLPDFPSKTVDEYPFLCLKLTLTDLISYLPYSYNPGDFLYLEDDIYNQTYLPLEVTELNKKLFLESKRKINITYPNANSYAGSIYIFLYKDENNIVLQNSVDAVLNSIKFLKIVKPVGKFNISNASCEVKTGEHLQRPLSLFQKTYAEKNYGIKLTGPFAVGRNVLRTPTISTAADPSVINLTFGGGDASTGIKNIKNEALITNETFEAIKAKHSYFFTFNGHIEKKKQMLQEEVQKVIAGTSVMSLISLTAVLDSNKNDTNVIEAVYEQFYTAQTKESKRFGRIYLTDTRAMKIRFNIKTLEFVPFETDNYLKVTYVSTSDGSRSRAPKNKSAKYMKPATAASGIKTKTDFLYENINIDLSDSGWGESFRQSYFYAVDPEYMYGPYSVRHYGTAGVPSYEQDYGAGDFYLTIPFGLWGTDPDYIYARTLFVDFQYFHKPKAAIAALFTLLLDFEGSDDNRLAGADTANEEGKIAYSAWAKESVKFEAERSRPVTHVINNPNVDSVFVSVSIRALKDTAHVDKINYESVSGPAVGFKKKIFPLGSAIPSIIRFSIECGYQDNDGNETLVDNTYPRIYEVRGIAETPSSIDIGRTENSSNIGVYSRFILGTQNIAKEIKLPEAAPNRIRFVRINRLTFESYSSLIRREIYLEKVTEIINAPFSYPFSTLCGLKLDARSISEIPARSYDARFKKVFVPSNYFPLHPSGKDKRYLTSTEYKNATTEEKTIYKGNWDGTFKFAWTDNPVWVLFDILINRRYGLGNFVDPTQVNYWELYKIGRYCDAVDSEGVFEGVASVDGGYEPRYSFNGVIADKTNVFDMLKTIISSFRGNLFYSNSEINFTNDRLKPVMAFFTNANVRDGVFSYSNDRRDLKYNVMEVSFLDRTDLFKEKIEYVENTDDIKNRGILRNSAQTFGVTSRAHAQRIGKHIIYSTVNEDQNIQFVAGLESLLCRPGDLIAVNDEMRSFKKHVGRILDVDIGSRSVLTNITFQNGDFNPSGVTGQVTILIPTGKYTSQEFYDLAKSPSKLNIGELYKNDIPMSATFTAILTGINDFGSNFYFDPNENSYNLIKDIKLGAPCSITLANTKQEIYKIASIKELNLNEYEVTATKFDTGKFLEIESGETLSDFYQYFPASRTGQINEGSSELISTQFKYDLGYPQITLFKSGNLDLQNDSADFTGSWVSVPDANCYDVELITPRFKSFKYTTTSTSINYEDLQEVGRYTLKVSARKTGVYPNLISPTAISGFKVVSYVAPIPGRLNGVVSSVTINTIR